MYQEGSPFLGGPDFSSLNETPPPPPEKTPEKLDLDDDDDLEADPKPKPKTLMDLLKEKPEETENTKKENKPEESEETEEATEDEESDAETESETEPEEIEDGEEDPSMPEITAEEEQVVATEIAKDAKENAKKEKEQANTPAEKTEATVAEEFHENFEEELKTKPPDEALDAAEQKTLTAAGVEKSEQPPQEPVEEPPVEEELPTAEAPPPAESTIELPEPEAPEDDPTTIPTPPTPPTPPAGGGGGTGLPPFGAGGPHGPGGPLGPGMPGGGGFAGGNVLPPTPNIAPNQTPDTYVDRHSHAPYVLAGGLVGYLLGRRRGRIRTEKKLLPIQHKLEREVEDLRNKIFWREAAIRSAVREHMAAKPEESTEIVERLKTHHERKRGDAAEGTTSEHARSLDPERLGRFAVDSERASQSEAFRTPELTKPIDLMTIPELLVIGERIKLRESNVKRLFETHRLNEQGLRRVIKAYLRGERYDQVLNNNLLSPEQYAYAETLQKNAAPDNFESYGGGLSPTSSGDQLGGNMQMVNPTTQTTLPKPDMPTPLVNDKKAMPVGMIAAGVVIAVLIVMFILLR